MSKRHGLPTRSLKAFMRDMDARMKKLEADDIDLAGLVGNRQTLSVLLASAAEVLQLRERMASAEARLRGYDYVERGRPELGGDARVRELETRIRSLENLLELDEQRRRRVVEALEQSKRDFDELAGSVRTAADDARRRLGR